MASMTALTACDTPQSGEGFPGEIGIGKPSPPPIDGSIAPGSLFKGREFFLSTAGSSLVKNCSVCHADEKSGAPILMGPTLEKSYILLSLYEGLIADPEDSRLLQEGTHSGPELTAEERQPVVKWLNLEMAELSQIKDPDAKRLSQALVEAGACMAQEDWTASGLDSLSTLQTKDGKACSDCHSAGERGVFINVDPAKTFEENRSYPIINRWVKSVLDVSRGQLKDLVPAGTLATYAASSCDPMAFMCHPAYELSPELSMGIDTFTSKTLDRWRHNACPVP